MKRKLQVLVIEDDVSLAGAFRRILREYEVTVCATIDAARTQLLHTRFCAVVSDVDLPDGCGLDLFEELRTRDPAYAARYVFVSGSASIPPISDRLRSAGVPYFSKPFEVAALFAAIVRLARGSDEPRGPGAV